MKGIWKERKKEIPKSFRVCFGTISDSRLTYLYLLSGVPTQNVSFNFFAIFFTICLLLNS